MTKFRIDRDVISTSGNQTFEVEADSIEEAAKKFENSEGEFIEEEINVESLAKIEIHDIYEGD